MDELAYDCQQVIQRKAQAFTQDEHDGLLGRRQRGLQSMRGMGGVMNRCTLLPAGDGGDTHAKALGQNPHGLLADLDLGADPGCRGGVLVQPQMHRFSSSMTSRVKSKPRRRPVNESSETRHLSSNMNIALGIFSHPTTLAAGKPVKAGA